MCLKYWMHTGVEGEGLKGVVGKRSEKIDGVGAEGMLGHGVVQLHNNLT